MNNEIRNESQALPESIRCVGADDLTLSLFENQYPVQPMGVSYNSYLILDEKVAVMDSVDARAAELFKQKMEAAGARVTLCDLTTTEVSYAAASAFYCGRLVLTCPTYDGGLFPPMEEFLTHLQAKGFRSRTVGLIENGSWAPAAARLMRAKLEEMKDLRVCGTVVSLRSALSPASEAQMDALTTELCAE